MPLPLHTRLIDHRAGRHRLYEVTNRREGRGHRDAPPADAVWLKDLGECDATGRLIRANRTTVLVHVTPWQAEQMRCVEAERTAA